MGIGNVQIEKMHTGESPWAGCILQYTGTINHFPASCSFQGFDCLQKPQKDSLSLLPFHFQVPALRALLQIMIRTWVKVSETYWRSNQSPNIKPLRRQDLEGKIYLWNIRHEFVKRLYGNYPPDDASKCSESGAVGKINAPADWLVCVGVCASWMEEDGESGKDRII